MLRGHWVSAWTTRPRVDETFVSWFARYAFLQDATPKQVAKFLELDRFPTSSDMWGVACDDATIERLATASRNDPDSLRAVEYGSRFGSSKPLAEQELSRWFMAGSARFCPACLVEDGYWRVGWEFGWNSVCEVHGCLLVWRCPNCSAVRRDKADIRTSHHLNPLRCRSCDHPFTATEAVEASDEQAATQVRLSCFAAEEVEAPMSRGTRPSLVWSMFEDAVRCLTACAGDADAADYLSPSGLPVAPKVTLAVADEALDSLRSVDAYERLLFGSMDTVTALRRDTGTKVLPDVRAVVQRYVAERKLRGREAAKGRRVPSGCSESVSRVLALNSAAESPIGRGSKSGVAA